MKKYISLLLLLLALVYCTISCKPPSFNNVVTADGNYPPEVANIMVNKCAVSGCHNAASYLNSDSLLLDTWEHLFRGSAHGSVVIPYNTKYSVLLYRTNTDPTLGFTSPPAMPFSADGKTLPLTKTEYLILSNWIAKGAPDKYGNIAFASDPDTRQKIYLIEQGSDLVSVIDAKSMLVMRYISIGLDSTKIENGHSIAISSDGMSAHLCFSASNYIQKIDTRTDAIVASIYIGSALPGADIGSWGIVTTSPAADTAIAVTNWQTSPTGIFNVLRSAPALNEFHFGSNFMNFPHGIASNYAFDTFYITAEYGNCIYKFSRKALDTIPQGDPLKKIRIDSGQLTEIAGPTTPDPHEIIMSPDYSRYFVTCENSNELRVMDAHADTLIKVIPLGIKPQEGALSHNPETPYLFIACINDLSSHPAAKGSVYVINYNTYEVVAKLYGDFMLPHDVTVDDRDGLVFIPSTNGDPTITNFHHCLPGTCNPGWYSVYDLHTLRPVNNIRHQVLAGPYSIAARFQK